MAITADRKLSSRQAAKLIYSTASPTPSQIDKVELAIRRGELPGADGATTAGAVAELLARASVARQGNDAKSAARGSYGKTEELPSVYIDSLKNYFLSSISRKHLKQQGQGLQRLVLAGQIAVLVVSVCVVAYAARMISPPRPAEQIAVLEWLEANTDHHRIIRWYDTFPAADSSGVRLRVQYHYTNRRGKGIDTDRLFLVQDDQVVRVDSEW